MPEIVSHGVRIQDPGALFGEYRVSAFDLARYQKLIAAGSYEEAIDDFVQSYMTGYVELYNATLINYMQKAQEGQMSDSDTSAMLLSIAALSMYTKQLLTTNFDSFMTVLGPEVFAESEIVSPDVQAMILKATLQQFEELTAGAMTQTSNNVLTQIRAMQTAMIIENQKISELDIIGKALVDEVAAFKDGLAAKFPQYYEALESGNILKSRAFGPDGLSVIRYNLADYSEMATRTTLLNVDRTAVEVAAGVNGDLIVQYYLRDSRKLKSGKEREACKEVLANGGLLALDQETADKLGIWTLEEARANGCMGPYCRHSIKAARQKKQAAA